MSATTGHALAPGRPRALAVLDRAQELGAGLSHLNCRDTFKWDRDTALADWHQLAARNYSNYGFLYSAPVSLVR